MCRRSQPSKASPLVGIRQRLQSLKFCELCRQATNKLGNAMAFSLYDATVTNYLQILGAVGGFLDKSLTHFRDKGVDPAEAVDARLAPDMAPLRFQIVSVAHHSRGAIAAAKSGVFSPSMGRPD